MKSIVVALGAVVVLASGCGSSDTCSSDTACAPGSKQHYHLCTGGSADNCYYQSSNGDVFRCVNCGQCTEAQGAVMQWCQTTPGSDLGLGGVTCLAPTTCPNGIGSFQSCASATGSSCSLKTSDGSIFDCNACDCTAAASQVTSWCTGGAILDMATPIITPLDMAMAPTCDPVKQDCGAGQKCIGNFADPQSSAVTGTCSANGTVAAEQPCTTPDPTGFVDNCLAGLICDNNGPDAAYVCRKICTADTDCAAGQRCSSLITANWGWCLPTCKPFMGASGCTAGNDCASSFDDISATASTEPGFFVCKKTGAGAVGAACQNDPDCGDGLWCDGNSGTCQGICDPPSHMCPTAAGSMPTCNAFSDQNGAGYCVGM